VLGSAASYVVLGAVVAAAIAVDLVRVGRQDEAQSSSLRGPIIDYALWTLLGFAVAIPVAVLGSGKDAVAYSTAYVLEKTLSLDNVAVFAAIFAGFAVAETARPRLLTQGIVGALALRVVFILAGIALLDAAKDVLIVFGALLLLTGVRMLRSQGQDGHAKPPRLPSFLSRWPSLAPLLALVVADVVFAVDSIPAAFGVTTKAFLVVASNAFAILGLRPTYLILVGGMARFRYLEAAVAVLLVIIGAKLCAHHWVHVHDAVSLGVVAAVLGGGVLLSVLRPEVRSAPPHGA
jgi:tellurite resistance protein TerC